MAPGGGGAQYQVWPRGSKEVRRWFLFGSKSSRLVEVELGDESNPYTFFFDVGMIIMSHWKDIPNKTKRCNVTGVLCSSDVLLGHSWLFSGGCGGG